MSKAPIPSPAQSSDELPALTFPAGLPGFSDQHTFVLSQWGGPDSPYSQLTSMDKPDLAFIVAPPERFFTDYEVELPDADAQMIDLSESDDPLVLVLITLAEPVEGATANLLGPLVVNTRTRLGAQIVLPDSSYGTQVPLISATASP